MGRGSPQETEQREMTEFIRLTPTGSVWAIKHGDGFLGYAHTREEASLIGQELVSWLNGQGRSAALAIDDQASRSLVSPMTKHVRTSASGAQVQRR